MTAAYSRLVWHRRDDPARSHAGDWLPRDLADLATELNRKYPTLLHRVEYTDAPDVDAIVADLFTAGREAKRSKVQP